MTVAGRAQFRVLPVQRSGWRRVDGVAMLEDRDVLAVVTLRRGDEAYVLALPL